VTAIEETGLGIASIVTLTRRSGLCEAVVPVTTIDPTAAVAALEARGFAAGQAWRG